MRPQGNASALITATLTPDGDGTEELDSTDARLVAAFGPRFTLGHLQTGDLQLSPLIAAIQETLNTLEKNKTDAFPSGHTYLAASVWGFFHFMRYVPLALAFALPALALTISGAAQAQARKVFDRRAG